MSEIVLAWEGPPGEPSGRSWWAQCREVERALQCDSFLRGSQGFHQAAPSEPRCQPGKWGHKFSPST